MALLTMNRKLKSIKVKACRGYSTVEKLQHNIRGFGLNWCDYVIHQRPQDNKFTALFQSHDLSPSKIAEIQAARFKLV